MNRQEAVVPVSVVYFELRHQDETESCQRHAISLSKGRRSMMEQLLTRLRSRAEPQRLNPQWVIMFGELVSW